MNAPEGFRITRFAMEMAMALFTALFGVVVIIGAREYGTAWSEFGPEPGFFPFYVGLLICLASAGVLYEAFARHRGPDETFASGIQLGRIAAFFGPMAAFVVVSVFLGLYVGTALYLFGVMVVQGGYSVARSLIVSLGVTVATYVLFEIWFQVPLLKGPLEASLGL
ncbi:tripartite tricarboxylate transporter TctB family protein [Marinivivus vitaminiproducens]|uniref:tripartite tricarboxylate transporter TctB family protein n=1 Tax=Marinivivus vitaminiproducens TaxID=3035935 RepID=UPI0027A7A0ED|nr:tripartite tricarboxylate transporter TctB family protein [Geminicoccaceae bacterium SCSIO 64248]